MNQHECCARITTCVTRDPERSKKTMVQRDMKSLSMFVVLEDRELLEAVKQLAAAERGATAELIASLAEVDARRLYLGEGCSSLFTYCTQVLHLSEHAAYGRIEAARAARKWPMILDALATGSVTVTSVALLARHLTPENQRDLLAAAHYKSKREVEEIVAALQPRPDVVATIRKLPERSGSTPHANLPMVDETPGAARSGWPENQDGDIRLRRGANPLEDYQHLLVPTDHLAEPLHPRSSWRG